MDWNVTLALLAGIAWCIGKDRGWDEDATGYLGWAFWLLLICF